MTAPHCPTLARKRESVAAVDSMTAGPVASFGGNRGAGYGIDGISAGRPFARPALSRTA